MSDSYFFYDLETSGFNPKRDRIMQFAGQRTDLSLKPIGEPVNYYIKLTPDTLPDPQAILITEITPQKTIEEGLTEAEFLKLFHENIATKNTVFIGFNSIRFDDEFMRFLHYRNFYDAYEWQWYDGKTRWDLLDLVRMTRALRPEGINWPTDDTGKPVNRLELLARANKLLHTKAHDALSDVEASIALAQLIHKKQPKLFDYLFSMRSKSKIKEFIDKQTMFVYSSGKYEDRYDKTTVVAKLTDHPKPDAALVYDLRYDPDLFLDLSPKQLAEKWTNRRSDSSLDDILPIKTLKFNRCPALAPLGVLDDKSKKRIDINLRAMTNNYQKLQKTPSFIDNILKALEILDQQQEERKSYQDNGVDTRLYEDFIANKDKQKLQIVRSAFADHSGDLTVKFNDNRLNLLLPLYKARNFPDKLSNEEAVSWQKFCKQRLMGGEEPWINQYINQISHLESQPNLTKNQKFLLDELKLYAESIIPDID